MADELPLHFDFPFQLWSYSKSHARLVLRGKPGEEYDEFVDVDFGYVRGMKLVSSYRSLTVAVLTDTSEIETAQPAHRKRGFLELEVFDGVSRGYVVCGSVRVRRGTGWQTRTTSRRWLLEQLELRPRTVAVDGSFAGYAAFLRGWQYGGDADWLQAFQGWLADEMGTGWNLGWEALILRLAFPDRPETWSVSVARDDDDEAAVRRVLFDKLREFDALFPETE